MQKNDNENSQIYNLLESNITKTVNLNNDEFDTFSDSNFKFILEDTYNNNLDELIKYIRP